MQFFPDLQHPLHLCSIITDGNGNLDVVVRQTGSIKQPPSPIGKDAWSVMSYPSEHSTSLTYSIRFSAVFAFQIMDETAAKPEDNAIGEGIYFVRYRKSRYLDYLEHASYGEDVHPGMRFHYQLRCQDSVVDAVTLQAPEIACLGLTAR